MIFISLGMVTQKQIDKHNVDSLVSELLKMNSFEEILLAIQRKSDYVNRGNRLGLERGFWSDYYLGVQALAGYVASGFIPKQELQIKFQPLIDKLIDMGVWDKSK